VVGPGVVTHANLVNGLRVKQLQKAPLNANGFLSKCQNWSDRFFGGSGQAARNGNKRRQWAAMIYPGEGKKGQPKAGDYVLAAEQTRAEAAADPHRSTAFDLARAAV
jgi:hypothetical protein